MFPYRCMQHRCCIVEQGNTGGRHMMLRIDSTRLHDQLEQRKEWIGFAPRATHVIALVEGLFLILTAVTTSIGYWWRLGFTVAAAIATIYAFISAIMTWSKGYSAEVLYKELIDMDRTERHSSIIAINDGNRYLLYHDTGWDCDFFPNHATADNEAGKSPSPHRLLVQWLRHSTGRFHIDSCYE